jgi:hypothetical protein
MWNPEMLAAVSAQVTWIACWPAAAALTLTGRLGAAPAGPVVGRDVLAVVDGCSALLVVEGSALLVVEGSALLVVEGSALFVAEGRALLAAEAGAVEGCSVVGAVVARNACGCPAAAGRSPADLASATAPATTAAMSNGMSPASISRRRRRRGGGSGPMRPDWGCFPPVTVMGAAATSGAGAAASAAG